MTPDQNPTDASAGTPPASGGLDPQVFADYLGRTRWFGGKGRPFAVSAVQRLGEVPGALQSGPRVVIYLVELTYGDVPADSVDAVDLYQVPLAFYIDPESRLDHAFVGWWQDPDQGWVHAYDALHDREAMACWLRSFAAAREPGGGSLDTGALTFHRLPGHELDVEAHSALFSGEQSNSSVAYGEDALMKVFRRVTPGVNPDIQIHEVLTRAGLEQVADLYGWVDTVDATTGEVVQLAMLQQFLRTASDGFELAKASVRNLYAEADLHADEVGGDFAAESARLGSSVAEVHRALREAFPSGAVEAASVADAMAARLQAALGVVPDLAEHVAALSALHARLARLGSVPVQRIHGDLHLGQTLRTSKGWKIVDFEGEPAKTLAERLLPDSPWRDVAGMLRSFDYAPHVVEQTGTEGDADETAQRAYRAAEWATRNRDAFVAAYAGRDLGPDERLLLSAYEADKAVYEVVYEARNRPTWVHIPLTALARLVATP